MGANWAAIDAPVVEAMPLAELLPTLYRAVLDAVADLEARGLRAEAADIRHQATRAYSRAWNLTAERRLRSLRARADRALEGRRAVLAGIVASL